MTLHLPPARDLEAYGPTSVLSEALLLGPGRIEPCACGGRIQALPGEEVERVVREHNGSPRHAAWRVWVEQER